MEVPVGVHNYDFECFLPPLLPYSVEGKRGFIRYKAEATLHIPRGSNIEAKKSFTVVRHDDLNMVRFQNYRQPCEVEKIKTFCCLFCESDPLIMTVRVPKTGFGLGDLIPIHVQMVNKSTTDVLSTELTLEKQENFNSTSPRGTKTYFSTVTSKTGRGVSAGQTVNFDEFIEIPRILSTSNDRFCKVYEIKYFIRFRANTGGFSSAMHFDIAIGNVGIQDGPPIPPSIQDIQVPVAPATAPISPPVAQTLDDLR